MIDGARAAVGLRRLATGLIAWGVVGLLVAAVGSVALVGVAGRVGTLGDRIATDVERLGVLLERTGSALDDAARTAAGFSGTVDRTGPAVRQAATAIRDIGPQLRDLETAAASINIFGSRPLAPLGGLFGQIAGELAGLDVQLDAIADDLGRNRTVLATNAQSLAALGDEVGALRDRLAGGTIEAGIDDARWLIVVTLALFVAWAALPAAGALALGIWLRRLLESAGPAGAVVPPRILVPAAPSGGEGAAAEPDPLAGEPFDRGVTGVEDQDARESGWPISGG